MVGSTVKVIRLVRTALGTSVQLVLRPIERELVWTWSRQPRWSAGQARVWRFPRTLLAIAVGAALRTRRVPSMGSVFVFHARPGPGVDGAIVANAPSYDVALKSLKAFEALRGMP